MLYMTLSGRFPFVGATAEEIVKAIDGGVDMASRPWPQVSHPGKEIVRKMLEVSDLERPTAAELLKHDWFTAVRGKSTLTTGVIAGLEDCSHRSVRLGLSVESPSRTHYLSRMRSSTNPGVLSVGRIGEQDDSEDFSRLATPLLSARLQLERKLPRSPLKVSAKMAMTSTMI